MSPLVRSKGYRNLPRMKDVNRIYWLNREIKVLEDRILTSGDKNTTLAAEMLKGFKLELQKLND